MLLAIWTLVPFYWLVSVSLMSAGELVSRPAHLYPHAPSGTSYRQVLDPWQAPPEAGSLGRVQLVQRGWSNSLLVGGSVTLVTLAVGLPLGYALGRLRFRYRSALLLGLITTRAYPPIATLIPLSAVFVALGLQGSLFGLIVADLTLTIPLVGWCMSGLFGALPRNLERAARVDGLTRWQTFWRVMVPMAAPGVASCAVIAFLTAWNEFTFSWILAAGSPAQTFPPTVAGAAATELATVSMLGLIPPGILALLVQRQIRRLHLVSPVCRCSAIDPDLVLAPVRPGHLVELDAGVWSTSGGAHAAGAAGAGIGGGAGHRPGRGGARLRGGPHERGPGTAARPVC